MQAPPEADQQWHKLCAYLMHRFAPDTRIEVTLAEMQALDAKWASAGGPVLYVGLHDDRLSFELMSREAAQKVASAAAWAVRKT